MIPIIVQQTGGTNHRDGTVLARHAADRDPRSDRSRHRRPDDPADDSNRDDGRTVWRMSQYTPRALGRRPETPDRCRARFTAGRRI